MMPRTLISFLLFFVAGIMVFESCKKQADSIAAVTPIQFTVPAGFPQPVYKFENNPLTQQGFELGKKLFFDGRLSKDGNFPCASCHQQFAAFATFDRSTCSGLVCSFRLCGTSHYPVTGKSFIMKHNERASPWVCS